MRNAVILALFLAVPLLAQEPPARHTIQARVNDRVITSGDVYRQVKGRWELLESQNHPNLEMLKAEAWVEARKELIEDELLVSAGTRLEKKFPRIRDFINRRQRIEIEEQRRELGGESKLRDFVEEKMGLTYTEYLEQVRRAQLRNFVLQREVLRPVHVRVSDMKDFYEENTERFSEPGTVRYRSILLRVESESELGERMRLAGELAERIRNGEDFRVVAAAFCEGGESNANAPADGRAPAERRLASLEPRLRRALEALEPGEVSEPLLLESEFAGGRQRDIRILKLEEREDTGRVSFEEAQETIQRELVDDRQARRYMALVRTLRETNFVWEIE